MKAVPEACAQAWKWISETQVRRRSMTLLLITGEVPEFMKNVVPKPGERLLVAKRKIVEVTGLVERSPVEIQADFTWVWDRTDYAQLFDLNLTPGILKASAA